MDTEELQTKPRVRLSALHRVKQVLRHHSLRTVCEEARCPNISTCFGRGVATILILGGVCSRRCTFCNISSGTPEPPDPEEPRRIAEFAVELGLRHLVMTSVTRDDIADSGAGHFVRCVRAVKRATPETTIEVLTPDFKGNMGALKMVLDEEIAVFNHNVETHPSLYATLRPGASFERSIEILRFAKRHSPRYLTKSGFMIGVGESEEEIRELIQALAAAGLDVLTIGQYFSPSGKHAPVAKSYTSQEFREYERMAGEMGIPIIYSAPFVRSSFNAYDIMSEASGGRSVF